MGRILTFLDQHLGYKTPQYVDVHDWRLGLCHRLLQVACVGYVVIWTICYKCMHLKVVPVSGYSRIDMSSPVKNGCYETDFTCALDLKSFVDLPYCSQGKLVPDPNQMPCEYRDALELNADVATPNSLFVPLFVDKLYQKRVCNATAQNRWHCDKIFVTQADSQGSVQRSVYIADIESYRLTISHVYEASFAPDVMLAGRSQTSYGYLQEGTEGFQRTMNGRVRHASMGQGVDVEIPKSKGKNPNFPTLSQTPWGVETTIDDLLRLANPGGAQAVLSMIGERKLTRRERGGVLSVSIEYSNAQSFDFFARSEPHYVLSARLLPMQWFYQWKESNDEHGDRHVESQMGLLIVARVHGAVRRFEFLSLLQVLTTSIVLLVLAQAFTDACMLHCTNLAQKHKLIRRGFQEQRFNHLDGTEEFLTRDPDSDIAGMAIEQLGSHALDTRTVDVNPF